MELNVLDFLIYAGKILKILYTIFIYLTFSYFYRVFLLTLDNIAYLLLTISTKSIILSRA